MCSPVSGEKERLVLHAKGNIHFFSEADFMGILNRYFFQIPFIGNMRDQVLTFVDITDVVHMPVDVGMAVGDGKMLFFFRGQAADTGRKGNFISRCFSRNDNPFLLREDKCPFFGIYQRSEGTR